MAHLELGNREVKVITFPIMMYQYVIDVKYLWALQDLSCFGNEFSGKNLNCLRFEIPAMVVQIDFYFTCRSEIYQQAPAAERFALLAGNNPVTETLQNAVDEFFR